MRSVTAGQSTPAPALLRFCARLTSSYWWAVLVSFLAVALICGRSLGADRDLFARVAIGHLTSASWSVPTEDPFAFTAKKPLWIDHEWVAGVVFANVAEHYGDLGLYLLKLLFALATLAVAAAASRRFSDDGRVSAPLLFLCGAQMSVVWTSTIRAHVFTYLGLALLFYAIAACERSNRRAPFAILPFYFLAWSNAHGGFVVGLAFFAAYVACRALERKPIAVIGTALLASVLAPAMNPYGPIRYWTFILEAVFMSRPHIDEWHPLRPGSPEFIFPALLAAATVVALVVNRKQVRLFEVALIGLSLYAGFRHQRLVAIPLLTIAVFGARHIVTLARRLQTDCRQRFQVPIAIVGSALALYSTIGLAQLLARFPGFDMRAYPVQALDWLERHAKQGRLLVDFNNGSYALWRLYPKFLVSVDGRYECVYPESTVQSVWSALKTSGSEQAEALQSIAPDYIVAEHDIAQQFPAPFIQVYDDGLFRLLTRSADLVTEPSGPVTTRGLWQPLF